MLSFLNYVALSLALSNHQKVVFAQEQLKGFEKIEALLAFLYSNLDVACESCAPYNFP